ERAASWSSLDPRSALGKWIELQLDDRHEVIRAQAAWIWSGVRRLSKAKLAELYTRASPISQAALAACAASQGNIPSSILSGITSDSPLNRAAATWAETRS